MRTKIVNHQKLDPEGILNPLTIHPKIDEKMNATNFTKRKSKRRAGVRGTTPVIRGPRLARARACKIQCLNSSEILAPRERASTRTALLADPLNSSRRNRACPLKI